MPIIGTGVPIIGLPQHLLVRLSLQNQICYGSECVKAAFRRAIDRYKFEIRAPFYGGDTA